MGFEKFRATFVDDARSGSREGSQSVARGRAIATTPGFLIAHAIGSRQGCATTITITP